MENITLPVINNLMPHDSRRNETRVSSERSFIDANTECFGIEEIKKQHVIPVFVKDNEPVISQVDFIEATQEVVRDLYHGETILQPSIRLSHPIKGRIPEAKYKAASELEDTERTVYYERMIFAIEIPSIKDDIN